VEAKEEPTDISFTNQEAEQIKDLAKQFPDLNTITRKFFGNEKLDGRSKQGIAIRSFLASNKINYKTSKYEKAADIEFTESQKEFIIDQTAIGLSAVRIAELIFPDRRIVNLGVEQRAVANFIRTANVEGQPESESAIGLKYLVPRSVERVINKINQATGEKINKIVILMVNEQGFVQVFKSDVKSWIEPLKNCIDTYKREVNFNGTIDE
jgi:hypothetical protein